MGLPGGSGWRPGVRLKWEGKARAGHQWDRLTASKASPSPMSEICHLRAVEVEWGLPSSAGVEGWELFPHTSPSPRNRSHPGLQQPWVWFPLEQTGHTVLDCPRR